MSRGRGSRKTNRNHDVKRSIHGSRVTLYCMLLAALPLAITLSGAWETTRRLSLVLIGFSSIIFLHELGHFVVARLCSVRCDVFSIGIGPRLFGWKKGVGFSIGKSPEDKKAAAEEKALAQKEAHKPLEEETVTGGARGAATFGDLEQTATPAGGAKTPARNPGIGETDYRISILPLGGYVRMLGQDDMDPTKVSSDPRSFGRRPIWQRMCIVSAGVIMNVITAAVIFSIIFHPNVGVKNPPAISGDIMYNSPAANAGFVPGMRVIEIDGKKPRGYMEFTDLMIASALSKGDKPVEFVVINAEGKEQRIKVLPDKIPGVRFLAIGVSPLPSTQIASVISDEDWKEAIKEIKNGDKLMRGDTITRIQLEGGQPIDLVDPDINAREFNKGYILLARTLQESRGKDVTITVRNPKRAHDEEIKIAPRFDIRLGQIIGPTPGILGMYPRVKVSGIVEGGPADKAGIQKGDIILQVGSAQNWLPSETEFRETVKLNPGKELAITVLRPGTGKEADGEKAKDRQLMLKAVPEKAKDDDKIIGRLQVGLTGDYEHPIIATHDKDAQFPIEEMRGSKILALNGTAVSSWTEVFDIGRNVDPEKPLTLKLVSADGVESTHEFKFQNTADKLDPLLAPIAGKIPAYAYSMGLPVEHLNWTQKATAEGGIGEGMYMGVEHTWKFMQQTYLTLRGLFIGTVSPGELHGIVGIAKVGYDVQDRGMTHLFFILAVVSVNLAVANFLPLPIVDGGLFLMLIVEKFRGKPLSLKLQHSIQLVGVVALIGLFLFVTWNDIQFVIGGK